jgi:hypothetical protein
MVARYKDRVGTLVVSGATALARNRSDPYACGSLSHKCVVGRSPPWTQGAR